MAGDSSDQLELKHGDICSNGDWTDGVVGKQEGGQVQERFRRKLSKEEVHNDSWNLVRGQDRAIHSMKIQ